MLLANYASDSGSDNEEEAGPSRPTPTSSVPAPSAAAGKVKRKAPVKITLDLPKSSTSTTDEKEIEDDEREFKKSKSSSGPKGGKGSSALLGMLPPPKRKLPAPKSSSTSTSKIAKPVPKVGLPKPAANLPAPPGFVEKEDSESDGEDEGMVPASVRRKIDKGKGSVDLFGLGDEPSASSSSKTTKTALPISISSAPTVADFIPPAPTPNDPYPGYYQTPSGEWAAYDKDYYHSFFPSQSQAELDEQEERGDGRVGRHWEEYNSKGADFIDIDVSKGLEEARIERERRALAVKPKMPGDEVEYKAVGQIKGLATERHQLSSLLNTAFTQKEELEQRITSNKKNMRVAAQKYGF